MFRMKLLHNHCRNGNDAETYVCLLSLTVGVWTATVGSGII